MNAVCIEQLGPIGDREPLTHASRPVPSPASGEVLIRVAACGVCHTELDEIEGRTPPPRLPVVPGHEVAGTVVEAGEGVDGGWRGKRVGVAWIHSACGHCEFCQAGRENLCPDFRATGRDVDGGYAEYMTVPAAFAHELPDALSFERAAPLLCAGAVGWRALNLCRLNDGEPLGLTGFGASAHLVLQLARHRYPSSPVYVFARDPGQRRFALELGADWAGDTDDRPPLAPAAIIDTTPAWRPVLAALACLRPGGRLVVNAIRKSGQDHDELQQLDYDRHLWREKQLVSVANVTRDDVRACLEAAVSAPLKTHVETFPLSEANRAIRRVHHGGMRGAAVLTIGTGDQ